MDLSFLKDQKIDINDKIIRVYKNKEIQRILNSYIKRIYCNNKRELYENIKTVKLHTIWKTIVNWDGERNYILYLYSSFKNNLYQEVKQISNIEKTNTDLSSIQNKYNKIDSVYNLEFLDQIKKSHKELLVDYYLKNMTLQEIAKKNNCSRQYIHKRLKFVLKRTRNILNGV